MEVSEKTSEDLYGRRDRGTFEEPEGTTTWKNLREEETDTEEVETTSQRP